MHARDWLGLVELVFWAPAKNGDIHNCDFEFKNRGIEWFRVAKQTMLYSFYFWHSQNPFQMKVATSTVLQLQAVGSATIGVYRHICTGPDSGVTPACALVQPQLCSPRSSMRSWLGELYTLAGQRAACAASVRVITCEARFVTDNRWPSDGLQGPVRHAMFQVEGWTFAMQRATGHISDDCSNQRV